MADDNTARSRSNDPYSRGPAAAGPASDPLAELARLIGQSDPFSEVRREPRAPTFEPDPGPRFEAAPAPTQHLNNPVPHHEEPRYAPEPPPYYNQAPQYEPAPPYEPTPPYEPAPHYTDPLSQRSAESQPSHQDWPAIPPSVPYPSQSDLVGAAPPRHAAHFSAQHPDVFADPHGHQSTRGYPQHVPGFDTPYQQSHARQSQPLYPHEPDAGSMPPPHDDEFYDDAPRGSRHRGLLTVAAVFALAIVGTAGAFGYRSLFSGPGMSGSPPVIRASGEPSKVAPPPQAPEQSAGKFSYDRFGDAGKDERVVRREETPVDIPRAPTTPRTVFPGAPVPGNTAAKSSAAMASANPPSALGEPRKVRTVPIRPDQGDVAANSPVTSEPSSVAPPRQINPPPPAQASRQPDPEPVEAPTSPPATSRATAPRPPAPRVAARTAPTEPPLANAPLSLAPDGANSNSVFPPPPTAVPQPRSAAPVRTASAPSSGGGSYLVQVTSQRSEADAQSSYRSIQEKYSSVLGGRPHVVRRADLGSKGVYYRAMVGPFSSREEAVQLCSSLKQAGGDCVVQH
jgi:hypothetical protein